MYVGLPAAAAVVVAVSDSRSVSSVSWFVSLVRPPGRITAAGHRPLGLSLSFVVRGRRPGSSIDTNARRPRERHCERGQARKGLAVASRGAGPGSWAACAIVCTVATMATAFPPGGPGGNAASRHARCASVHGDRTKGNRVRSRPSGIVRGGTFRMLCGRTVGTFNALHCQPFRN